MEFLIRPKILFMDITTEIKQRIIMVNKPSNELKKQLHSLDWKRHTNCMLHKSPYKTDPYKRKSMLVPLKEGWKYVSNLLKKNITKDLRSY
jgi:hypothetical protein